MKNFVRASVLLLIVVGSARARQSSGTYFTYNYNQRIATETYSITPRPGGILEAEAEIEIAGSAKIKTATRTSANKPVSYSEESGGTKLFSADYALPDLKLQIPGRPDVNVKTKASAVLENLRWHQYILLLNQYDGSKAGRQDFVVSVPRQAKDIAIRVERRDSPVFNVAAQSVKTEHYKVTLGASTQIEIWTDMSRIPLLLLLESQALKAIHQGSEALAEAILAARQDASASPAVRFSDEEIAFKNGELTLGGTLSIPQDGARLHPAVVMITGSGLQDRDDNPGGYSMFKMIAQQLASHGIAVLRHDDRGFGKSSIPERPSTYHDLINDTRAAVAYLRGRSDIDPDRIGLAGHSEGGFTASVIAADDQKISGIALLAGAALTNIVDLMNEQVLYELALQRTMDPSDHSLEPSVVTMLRQQISGAKAGKPDVKMNDYHEYWRQHLALDISDVYKRVHCPVLILQGERDINVLALHAVEVALKFSESGNKGVRLRIIPDVDHAFVQSPRDKCATDEQRTRTSPDFLNALQNWATEVFSGKKANRMN